jgi:serine/threonine protein kinase
LKSYWRISSADEEGEEENVLETPSNGMVNLVMEYMDGGSLDDLVKNGGCQDEVVLADISRQALTGLAFLHANHSVHSDIKPANILCSSSGVVKIADFGISKVMDAPPPLFSGENHLFIRSVLIYLVS